MDREVEHYDLVLRGRGRHGHPVSPRFSAQRRHLTEMLITANKRQIVLQGKRGNPDVVFWYRTALLPQFILDLAITLDRPDITAQNSALGGEFVDAP